MAGVRNGPPGTRTPRTSVLLLASGLSLLLLVVLVRGDTYINNPRGSNNKLNEQNNNRQNANRLFDSQNNAAGGYQVGDNCDGVCQNENGNYDPNMPGAGEGTMYYYPESVLYVEWTQQHASGMDFTNPNVHSEVVLQYMCNDDVRRPDSGGVEITPWDRFQTGIHGTNASDSLGLRDGKTTQTIPDDPVEYNDAQYGMHESYGYYQDCKVRERNKGLWTADENVRDDKGARATRQEPNGNQRYGFECPEERDYYPYWHPTPWKDIAVLMSDMNRCRFYQDNSENVKGRNFCEDPTMNNMEACTDPPVVSRWALREPHDLDPPECVEMPYSRDNHHGNSADGFPINYNWTLPREEDFFRDVPDEVSELTCVLRLRYNISSGEGYNLGWLGENAMLRDTDFVDKRFNGGNSPVKNDPLDDWVGIGHNQSGPLRLAINTEQTGRVFQDRTHIFKVRRRPDDLRGKKIWNLNVRGRRGNIVQVYPSVEYDFAPTQLVVTQGDYIHYQWTGSDANANNDGEGRQRTDRSNIVQYSAQDSNLPGKVFFYDEFGEPATMESPMFVGKDGKPDADVFSRMAFLNQTNCDSCYHASGPRCELLDNRQTNNGQAQNSLFNCAVLNRAPAYFDGGVLSAPPPGTYRYMSTRNNNFSNRSQKGIIKVRRRDYVVIITASVIGGAVALTAVGAAAMMAAPAASVALAGASGAAAATTGTAAGAAGAAAGGTAAGATSGGTASLLGQAAAAGCCGLCGLCACCAPLASRWRKVSAWRKAVFYLVIVCVAFAVTGFLRNSSGLRFSKSVYFAMAKAGGYLLDFAMTAILFPMMRNLISWLRTTPVTDIIPLDDNHAVHILLAKVVAVGVVIHVVGHYLNMNWHGVSITATAFSTLPGLTGHLALLCMMAMYLTSVCRKGVKILGLTRIGGFDSFWFTHQLYLAVYLLLILHAEAFYRWLFWPAVLFAVDKGIHYLRGQKECHLVAVRQEARGTDVMSLQMRVFLTGRLKFHHRCGQYLMLQCPELGREWHPFTITSAPEEDFVSVHIRCRGDWTKALQKRLNPEGLQEVRYRPKGSSTGDAETAKLYPDAEEEPCELRVDGPYGSGSDRTDEYDTVMLVGTGIGVTPFASVMKSLKIRQQREGAVRPSKVYFYWVCRDQKEFDWFSWLIEELQSLDPSRFKMNTYLTGELNLDQMIKDHANAGPAAFQEDEMATLLKGKSSKISKNMVAPEEAEMISTDSSVGPGTKWAGQKWAGRPNWRRIFKEQEERHRGEEIGVFLCGPGAEELQMQCTKNSTDDTKFVFHKEVF